VGSSIRIGPGIEEGEPSLCGDAPGAVIPDGVLKCPDPTCTHPKTYHGPRPALKTDYLFALLISKPSSCVRPESVPICFDEFED
jgi:hypothetical protein